MRTKTQKYRWLSKRLPQVGSPRIVVLTGARQTGKTTLARALFPSLRYVNLDSLEERELLRVVRTASWAESVGPAVLDEAQKEPTVFDKVKWAFDEGQIDFTVLLGSSRILLMERVKETLAGRAYLYDLWPLMASELMFDAGQPVAEPLLHRLVNSAGRLDDALGSEAQILLGPEEERRRQAVDHLAQWGGMPGLLPLEDEDRREWLRSYQQTFLERDLADLVRLSDLHPFRTMQQLCMLRTGQLLSYADLARDAGLSAATARRYLEYLRISYQTVLLQPYRRNLTSVLVKAPKLYWIDLGLLRQGTRQWGPLTGAMFETLAVGEIHKWLSSMAPDTQMSFYRTRSGMEVDLLLDTPAGVIGLEFKGRDSIGLSDGTSMRALARALGDEWRGGLIVHTGHDLSLMSHDTSIWAMPLHRLVS